MKRTQRTLTAALALATMAGCGSNGSENGTETPPPSGSAQSFTDFARSLVATAPDDSEPVEIDQTALQQLEDVEPEEE